MPEDEVKRLRESWQKRDEAEAERNTAALPELPDDPKVNIVISIRKPPPTNEQH